MWLYLCLLFSTLCQSMENSSILPTFTLLKILSSMRYPIKSHAFCDLYSTRSIEIEPLQTGSIEIGIPYPNRFYISTIGNNEIWKTETTYSNDEEVIFPSEYFRFEKYQNVPIRKRNISESKYKKLLKRRWNEVVEIRTHNAQSHCGILANQDRDIKMQLEDGIRSFHIAIHYDELTSGADDILACHGLNPADVFDKLKPVTDKLPKQIQERFKEFEKDTKASDYFPRSAFDESARPLRDILKDIKNFLDTHPEEIICIEFGGTATHTNETHPHPYEPLAHLIQSYGLNDYAYSQNPHELWPTLEELISNGKRLLFFVRGQGDERYPWLNRKSHFFFSTDYGFATREELEAADSITSKLQENSNYKRRLKHPRNTIFEITHSLTPLVAGTLSGAQEVNAIPVIMPRINKIINEAQFYPKLISIDFYEYSDGFEYADMLNRALQQLPTTSCNN